MEITVNDTQVIVKIIPTSVKFNFDIDDLLKKYDIESEDEIELYVYEYLRNNTEYSNIIFDLVDGESLQDYDSNYEFEIDEDEMELLISEIAKKAKIERKSCCDKQTSTYCPICGKKLK